MHHVLKNPPPKIQTMTGREAFSSTPEGRNTLRVRQFSDISASEYCDESALRDRKEKGGLLVVSTGVRSCRHQMIAGEKESA
jgi:hypothetical protein